MPALDDPPASGAGRPPEAPAPGEPGRPGNRPLAVRLRSLAWSLVWPEPRHRTVATLPGVVLIALCMAVGGAAYNAANNILFITLSMLLSCLILSGLVAWMNLDGIGWELENPGALRAGLPAILVLRVRNRRRLLPAYALAFEFEARERPLGRELAPQTTFTARGIDVRALLGRAGSRVERGKAGLTERLDPGATTRVEWSFTPARRGLIRLRMRGVGSFFPFGFLGKFTRDEAGLEVVVHPAPVPYEASAGRAARLARGDAARSQIGDGGDPIGIRRYQSGDSHRAIHWKATARARHIMVRQVSAQGNQRLWLHARADGAAWGQPARFELMLGLAASLAEDLFRAGRLRGASFGDRAVLIRRVADLEAFLDLLALAVAGESGDLPPDPGGRAGRADETGGDGLYLAPDGPSGVCALFHGSRLYRA